VALSGYVLGPPGRRGAAFALIVTGITEHGPVRDQVDRVVMTLVEQLWN
jgi:hypothetical protein